jgi:hypothetical protein
VESRNPYDTARLPSIMPLHRSAGPVALRLSPALSIASASSKRPFKASPITVPFRSKQAASDEASRSKSCADAYPMPHERTIQ